MLRFLNLQRVVIQENLHHFLNDKYGLINYNINNDKGTILSFNVAKN